MTLPRILSLGVRYWLHRYWTAAALLLLLATGAASAVVAMVVVWTVWGRPLPFRAPAELLAIADSRTVGISEAEFADWADRQRTLEEIASYDVTSATMVELALMKYPARVATVTPNLFRLLGVSPAVGRVFHGGDRGAPIQIGVVSDAFFRRVMGGDPNIIGTTITLIRPLERSSLRVVGVLPAGADLDYGALIDVYVVAPPEPADRAGSQRRAMSRRVLGRVAATVNAAAVQDDFARIQRDLEREYSHQPTRQIVVQSLHSAMVGSSATVLRLYGGAGTCVLLVAVMSCASLLLAGAGDQARDMSVRLALGAGVGALRGEAVARSLLLALAVALASGGVTFVLVKAVVAYDPYGLPRLQEAARAAGETASLAAALAGVLMVSLAWLVDVVTMRHVRRRPLLPGAWGEMSVFGRRWRQVLVTGQVAMGVPLLVLSGAFALSMRNLNARPLGFDMRDVVMVEVPVLSEHRGPDRYAALLDALVGLGRAQGVDVGATFEPPLSTRVHARTRVDLDNGRYGDVVQVIQTEGVHAALGVPLLQGRFFTRDDRMRGLPVVIVNRQFVSRFLGERQNPIGRTISYGGQPHTIVGVVGDTQELSVRQELKPVAYFPFRTEQWQPARVFLVARLSSGGVQEWVSRVQSLVPGIAVEAHPLTIRWTREAAPIRFAALSLSGIGLVSLILLAVGVSAVVVKTVADQQRRLAVQMALGAPIPLIQRQVTSSLFWPVAVGMAAGLLLARAVSPLFDSLVFETSVFDMSIWVVALVVVTASAAVPAWTVSRRVFLLDPATILRES